MAKVEIAIIIVLIIFAVKQIFEIISSVIDLKTQITKDKIEIAQMKRDLSE